MTQVDLANAIGVHKTVVNHWVKRHSRPDQNRLPAVAAALDVTVDELLEDEAA